MFCENCGKELNENARFCPKCGQKVVVLSDLENGLDSACYSVDVNIDSHSDHSISNNKRIASRSVNKLCIVGICGLVIIFVGLSVYFKSPDIRVERQIKLGNKYLQKLDYDQAVAELTKALEIDPNDKEAKQLLAYIYVEWGEELVRDDELDLALAKIDEARSILGDMDEFGYLEDKIQKKQAKVSKKFDKDSNNVKNKDTSNNSQVMDSKTITDSEIMSEYKKILERKEYQYEVNNASFAICDLNSDGISELIVDLDGMIVSPDNLYYTYYNDRIMELDSSEAEYPVYGVLIQSPKRKSYCFYRGGPAYSDDDPNEAIMPYSYIEYSLEGDKIRLIGSFGANHYENSNRWVCYKNGKECTYQEYQQLVSDYTDYGMDIEFYNNTIENRTMIFDVYN